MAVSAPERPTNTNALIRGALGRCPRCGRGPLLHRYLKVVGECSACGEPYGHFRADDAPPWLTILLVGHLVAPFFLLIEENFELTTATELAILIPLVVGLDARAAAALQGRHPGDHVGDEGGRHRAGLRQRRRIRTACRSTQDRRSNQHEKRRRDHRGGAPHRPGKSTPAPPSPAPA